MEREPDLTFDVQIADPNYTIPPMLLQPIIENCFKHSRLIDDPKAWVHISIRQNESGLLFTSDNSKPEAITHLFAEKGLDYTTAVLIKSVSNDLKGLDLGQYDLVVFYNPSDVKSLYENFPEFTQGDLRFISYGHSIVKAMEESGLQIAVKAPSPEHRSVAGAIESYLKDNQ